VGGCLGGEVDGLHLGTEKQSCQRSRDAWVRSTWMGGWEYQAKDDCMILLINLAYTQGVEGE